MTFKTEVIYPKRLIRDEGKVRGGRLLPDPLPRDAGASQELPIGEAGGELQGHVVEGLFLLRGTAAGQTHVEAEVGEEAGGRGCYMTDLIQDNSASFYPLWKTNGAVSHACAPLAHPSLEALAQQT